ncbi:type 1 glutamine amidotransferase domain-containing protein [Alkanindiges sp. WGS2144]|uniref:type 1 glutamine amidotransferase domain-containing protein n=1 Tax=Alkanindiges sp. WGS2144 TaxID=3366808 RepID=UPI00375024A0
MAKLAFVVHNYFEQVEFTEVREILEEYGHETTLISTKEQTVQGMEHDVNKKDQFQADLLLKDMNVSDYDALVLPGGTVNADKLRINSQAQQLIKDFLKADKLVAAICHAPWLLVSSGVVKGKKMTAFESLKDDINNAGATYIDEPVVCDGNLITSRKPDDIPAFAQVIDEFFIKHDSK